MKSLNHCWGGGGGEDLILFAMSARRASSRRFQRKKAVMEHRCAVNEMIKRIVTGIKYNMNSSRDIKESLIGLETCSLGSMRIECL